MSERHSNPEPSDELRPKEDPAPVPSNPPRWLTAVLIGVGIFLVVMFVLLHLSGAVGPAAH